jgi:hypothetical protein
MRTVTVIPFLFLVSCSSFPGGEKSKPVLKEIAGPATTTTKHPLAKYIELGGFRLSESGAGKLRVKFVAVNHSEADLSELTVKIRLITSVAKPGEPPVTEFEAKIPALGPQEIKDVSATAATKLRVYEMPDWQFLRAEFDILSPAP